MLAKILLLTPMIPLSGNFNRSYYSFDIVGIIYLWM